MSPKNGWRKARLAAGLFRYLREATTPETALAAVQDRAARRSEGFLRLADEAIFADERSPHRALLVWAGWDRERLAASVEASGLEPTLEALRDAGVHTSLDEFKGRARIRRGELDFEAGTEAFHDRRVRGRGLGAGTSGTSSGSPTRVLYDWPLLREEAELECLLFGSHGLLVTPSAIWLPSLPGVAGIHNLLLQLRFRQPTERWFSQVRVRRRDLGAFGFLAAVARAYGLRAPVPEEVPVDRAGEVVRWMLAARERAGAAVLKTFASSAVRVAEAALSRGETLEGCVILSGGEPLTPRRSEFIRSSGAKVYARYVATETGLIAGECPQGGSPGTMHLHSDRLAAIPSDRGAESGPLLLTTLSATAGAVLLNTDIGDAGVLRPRPCPCALGRAGLATALAAVHGHDKLSAEGMTVLGSTVERVLGEVVEAAGGAPDSYQLREEEDSRGAARLVLVVSPEVRLADAELRDVLLDRLRAGDDGTRLAASFWRDADTIEVRRERPRFTEGAKFAPYVPRTP